MRPYSSIKDHEKRRRYRVKVRLPLTVKSDKGDTLTYTTNISLLGAYVESNKRLRPSPKKRELVLELTPSRWIRCWGVILRCDSKTRVTLSKKTYYHLNIFFSSFFDNGEQRLADHLQDVLARQKKVLDGWIKEKTAKEKASKKEAAKKEAAKKKIVKKKKCVSVRLAARVPNCG